VLKGHPTSLQLDEAYGSASSITQDGFGTATFVYDGHQQRIRKITPLGETVYVGDLYERITPADPNQPVEHHRDGGGNKGGQLE
jgi:hypothetical protein